MAASLSSAVTGCSDGPARLGSHRRPDGASRRDRVLHRAQQGERGDDGPQAGRRGAQEPAAIDGAHDGFAFSATSFTAYPAWARRTAIAPPPGHMTMSPPSATTIPPYHTHHTSGLMVKR